MRFFMPASQGHNLYKLLNPVIIDVKIALKFAFAYAYHSAIVTELQKFYSQILSSWALF